MRNLSALQNAFADRFSPNAVNWLGVAILATVFAMRTPLIAPWVLDGDESTFILLGRDFLQGNWPLVDVWDSKFPPFIAIQGIALFLAGGTHEGMRIIATLVLCGLVYLTKLLSENLGTSNTVAWLAGLSTALAFSDNPSSAHLGTELLGAFFLVGGLVLLTDAKQRVQFVFWAGVLFALAVFMRPNFAYTIMAICLTLSFFELRKQPRDISRLVSIVAGGSAVILAFVVPYLLMGRLDEFWKENILLSLDYNENFVSHRGLFGTFRRFLAENPVLFAFFAIGGWGVLRRLFGPTDYRFLLVLSAFLGTCIGMISGPRPTHYLMMIAPFAGLFAALSLSEFWEPYRRRRRSALALIMGGLTIFTIVDVQRLGQRGIEQNYAERIYTVLNEHRQPSDTFFFFHEHINYQKLDADPPLRMVHPYNIMMPFYLDHFEPEAGSPAGMLELILEREFDWVVANPAAGTFRMRSATKNTNPDWRRVGEVLEEQTDRNYLLFHHGEEGSIFLHKRHASRMPGQQEQP